MPSPMAFDRMRELLEKMGDRGQDLLTKYFPQDELNLEADGEVPEHGPT